MIPSFCNFINSLRTGYRSPYGRIRLLRKIGSPSVSKWVGSMAIASVALSQVVCSLYISSYKEVELGRRRHKLTTSSWITFRPLGDEVSRVIRRLIKRRFPIRNTWGCHERQRITTFHFFRGFKHHCLTPANFIDVALLLALISSGFTIFALLSGIMTSTRATGLRFQCPFRRMLPVLRLVGLRTRLM